MFKCRVETGLIAAMFVAVIVCGTDSGLGEVVDANVQFGVQHELLGHRTGVTSAAFSPDGRQLVTAGATSARDRGELIFWDVQTGRNIRSITGHDGIIHAVAWLADGRTLATASRDRTVKLWDVASGTEQASLEGHRHWVLDVAVSADSRHLASAGRDGDVRLWNLETNSDTVVAEHTQWVMAVALSRNGRMLASVSADTSQRLRPGQLIINDLGQPNAEARIVPLEAGGYAVAIAPERDEIVVGLGNRTIQWFDMTTGEETRRWKAHCDCLALSPDGHRLLSGGTDRLVKLWDVQSGRLLSTLKGHSHTIYDVAFAPNSRQMTTASRDRTARIWDTVDFPAAVRNGQNAGRPRRGRAIPAKAGDQPSQRIWLLLGVLCASGLLYLIATYLDRRQGPDTADEVVIDLPDGPVNVPRKPIASRATSHCDARLVQPRPDLIVVTHPNLRSIGCGGVLFLVTFVCVFFIIQFLPQGRGHVLEWVRYVLGAIVGGLVAVFCGFIATATVVDNRRFRFDGGAHEIRMGLPGFRETRSLDDVAALQLIPHDASAELNLLFRAGRPERRNVSCHENLLWTWRAARVLGGFLNVPLIDQFTNRDRPRVIESREFDGLPPAQRTAAWLSRHVSTDHVNSASSSSRNRVLRRKDADRLVVRRGFGENLIGFLAVLLGIAISLGVTFFFLGDWIHADRETYWIGNASVLGWATMLIVYLWRVSRWRVILDRLNGRIIYGPGWERQQRPLDEVVAVQIIPGPVLRPSEGSRVYHTEQLNLVFDDPPLPRLNVSCHTEKEWTRATAQTLADFLNVPLLNQTGDVAVPKFHESSPASGENDAVSLATPRGLVPYGVDTRPMPSGEDLDNLLPPRAGSFRRSTIQRPENVHNTPIYARYRDGDVEIFVELGIGDSASQAQQGIETAQAETSAEFPKVPQLVSTGTDPAFLKTSTSLGAFMAWTRGRYYFSAHCRSGEGDLDRFMVAFPY